MRAVLEAQIVKVDLLKWDPDGDTAVWIRQAVQADEARRRELLNTMKGLREGEKYYEIYELPTSMDVMECWLTFSEATIVRQVGGTAENPIHELIFKKNMSEREFRAAFAQLPEPLAAEWHAAVRKINPRWGWTGEEEAKN